MQMSSSKVLTASTLENIHYRSNYSCYTRKNFRKVGKGNTIFAPQKFPACSIVHNEDICYTIINPGNEYVHTVK